MWGSDYPHHDATFPGAVDTLRRTMAPLAPEVQAKILGANAAGLYGLPHRHAVPPPARNAAAAAVESLTVLGDVVREAAARYGDTPLYVTPDGRELSYAALDRLSDDVAAGLRARGVQVDDVVALLLPSGPAYAVAYAAAAKIGAVTAGVNDRLSPPERRRCLAVARPRLVVASKELALDTDIGDVAEVRGRGGGGRRVRRSIGAWEPGTGAETSAADQTDAAPRPPRPRPATETASHSRTRTGPWPWCSRPGPPGTPRARCSRGASSRPSATVDGGGRWGGGGRGCRRRPSPTSAT